MPLDKLHKGLQTSQLDLSCDPTPTKIGAFVCNGEHDETSSFIFTLIDSGIGSRLRFLKHFFKRKAKLGTAENPEILEPGEVSKEKVKISRFTISVQILKFMFWLALPALLFDWLCVGLIEMGSQPNGWFAWILLLFLAPPAALITLVAVVAELFLAVVLGFILSGKKIAILQNGVHSPFRQTHEVFTQWRGKNLR